MAKPVKSGTADQKRRQAGTALVEFALVAPLLLVLMFGIVEFGRILNTMAVVTNAAREGARRGSVGEDDGQVRTTINTYLANAGLDLGQLTSTIARSSVAGTPQIDVTLTYQLDLLLPTLGLVPNPLPITGQTVMRVE